MPLLAACIPLLAAGPQRNAVEDYVDSDGDFPDGTKPTTADIARRMAMVWLSSLLIFASPHQGTLAGLWDPVIHRPVFLIFAPLLLALLPVLFPVPVRRRSAAPRVVPALSRSRVWFALTASVLMAILLILALVGLNNPGVLNAGGSKMEPNIILLLFLAGDLFALLRFVRQLRGSR